MCVVNDVYRDLVQRFVGRWEPELGLVNDFSIRRIKVSTEAVCDIMVFVAPGEFWHSLPTNMTVNYSHDVRAG
jgi:hypothetical protein